MTVEMRHQRERSPKALYASIRPATHGAILTIVQVHSKLRGPAWI